MEGNTVWFLNSFVSFPIIMNYLLCLYFMFVEDIVFRTAEATQLPPQVLAEEVICLDSTSSGSEDDTKGKNSIKDGK